MAKAAQRQYGRLSPRKCRTVIGSLAIAVLALVGLIIYQSVLTAAFFSPRARFDLDAYRYVFTDRNFQRAAWHHGDFSFGMVAITVPLGGLLAFLISRIDIKAKRLL